MSQEEKNLEAAPSKKFRLDHFVEDNQRQLMIAGAALIVLAAAIWYYKAKYQPQQEAKANNAMFMAERYFGRDSLDLALNGDGTYDGLLDIIDQYPRTKSGQRAQYYAGVTMMKKGQYEEAIDHLKKVDFDDEMVGPLSRCLIGDSHVELDNLESAGKAYMKAAGMSQNDFTTPYALLKAARVYSSLEQWDKALKSLKTIQSDYSNSRFAEDIDKLIARAETASLHQE